jgi:ATP-dependent helicase/nuclease subunit A
MVRRGFAAANRALIRSEAPYGPVEIWQEHGEFPRPVLASPEAPPSLIEIPPWLTQLVESEPEPAPPIRPSSALGAADRHARPGDGPYAPEARMRGVLVHALLERLPALPAERRADVAEAFVAARAPRLSPDRRERIVADALGILRDPRLARLFGPGSRAEAPIAGRIRIGGLDQPVSGQIDRLAVFDDEVLVADFKTSARAPSADEPAPGAHVAQLALYRALLQEIYDGRRVRAFLIWTGGPVVRELTEVELDAALTSLKAS